MNTPCPLVSRVRVFQRARGFTLIELLTVIAIIGILAAILVPVVGSVRTQARSANCLSRLRQIGTAYQLFAEANKGYSVPDAIGPAGGPANAVNNWYAQLIPFTDLKADSTGLIAHATGSSDYSQDPRFFYMCPGGQPMTWRWTNYLTHPVIMRTAPAGGVSYKISRVARPSQVILIADGAQNPPPTGQGQSGTTDSTHFSRTYNAAADSAKSLTDPLDVSNPDTDSSTTLRWLRYRHNGAVNCLYVDGHVKSNKRGTLTYGNVIDSR
jgi:prepilin-type N-terminal cleavage/methylation domain-containing protein/prepilin-type processing-associated H-X9-DG protein